MKLINNININEDNLPVSASSRRLRIAGDVGSKCKMQIHDASSPVKFYDFTTQAFSVGCDSAAKFLKCELDGGSFNTKINFPASGSSYRILVFTSGNDDTEISSDMSSDEFLWSTTIEQSVNATITFTPITTNTNNFGSMPASVTSVYTAGTEVNVTVPVNWTITSAASDTYGYGLKVDSDELNGTSDTEYFTFAKDIDSYFYFDKDVSITDGVSNSNTFIVEDLTDIGVGMTIVDVDAGSVSGVPVITDIDTSTNLVTVSVAQTFNDGATLTCRASGKVPILEAIGVGLSATTGNWSYVENRISKVVRSSPTDEDIELNGSRGISAGSSISGLNVNNDGTNLVQSVTLGATTSGSVTMQLNQTGVIIGDSVVFYGSTDSIALTGEIQVSKYPLSNRTIYLNLDGFINIGTQIP